MKKFEKNKKKIFKGIDVWEKEKKTKELRKQVCEK